ncbi:MAG: hypothetical protein LBH16_10030 [Treponema sp.]|nr:hypothetical protein [Treponema sp.]
MERIIQIIQDWFHALTAAQKRQIVLVSAAIFVILLVLSVILSVKGSKKEEIPSGPVNVSRQIPIPAEELFLPDEPDFIPDVLLQREQRSVWNEKDASVFWQDPLASGEEQWRKKIETAVDELMENVP